VSNFLTARERRGGERREQERRGGQRRGREGEKGERKEGNVTEREKRGRKTP